MVRPALNGLLLGPVSALAVAAACAAAGLPPAVPRVAADLAPATRSTGTTEVAVVG
ncbi:MAG: hypothetical protein JWM10_5021, partial [Myxococcaceae bacterium]|nr:hypothetical protein [Myxococcaceae bacterium]